MKRKFSIIIPAYNCEKEIEQALNSVLEQEFKDYEIIVVDDCSTDDTYQVVSKYKNIQVIKHEKNKKAGGTRNTAINMAIGEYILFLDADDYLASSKTLLDINKIIDKKTPDIVYLGFEIVGKTERIILPSKENSEFCDRIRKWEYPNVWDICWNRKFLIENNMKFIEECYFEDFLFYYEGIVHAKSYAIANFATHIYTVKMEKSITSLTSVSVKKIKDIYQNINKMLNLVENAPEKYKKSIIYATSQVVTYSMKLLQAYEEM